MNTKNYMLMIMIVTLAFVLAACGSSPAQTGSSSSGESYISTNLDTTYEGATPVRNQLALGTLALAGTPNEITPEQAAQLLPLWQALRSTSKSGGSAQEEVNALLAQIESTMNKEQLAAIREIAFVQTDIQEWAKTNGIALGSGGGQPGSGQDLSPEARATRQAAEGRTNGSSGGISTALIDAVITYLDGRGG